MCNNNYYQSFIYFIISLLIFSYLMLEAYHKQRDKNKQETRMCIEQILKISEWPRKKSVTIFRLISGHDCLRKHLYRISVTPYSNSICPLCDRKEDIDLLHLRKCHDLPHTLIWECYWVARASLRYTDVTLPLKKKIIFLA